VPALNYRQLADALQTSPATIVARRKAGMPVDSIEAALAWSAQNVKPRGGRRGNGFTKATAKAQRPAVAPPQPVAGDPQELREAKELAARTFSEAMTAPPPALPGLVTAYHRSLESVNEVERMLEARARAAGELLHADQVRSLLAARDGKIIALLESLPDSVAMAANPADPELARSAVADAVEQLRVTVASDAFLA
jgi:hypothetical protein